MKKRPVIIPDNPVLDKIAQRFQSKIRSLERDKKFVLEDVAEIDRKLAETRSALAALKSGAK